MAINKKGATALFGVAALISGYAYYRMSSFMSDGIARRKERPNELKSDFLEAVSIQIENNEGAKLNAYYYDYHAPVTMMILHPYRLDSLDMLSYVEFFKEKFDCNFLLIDIYGHGASEGSIYQLGGEDQKDLLCWIHYWNQNYQHKLILFGKELGANIILNTSNKLNEFDNVKVIISDGAYTSVKDIISYRMLHDYYVFPYPFIWLMKWIFKIRYGLDLNKLDTKKQIGECQIPIMFIHTKKDCFVPLKQVFPLYNHAKCEKELFVLKNEEALFQLDEDREEEYFLQLDRFIKKFI